MHKLILIGLFLFSGLSLHAQPEINDSAHFEFAGRLDMIFRQGDFESFIKNKKRLLKNRPPVRESQLEIARRAGNQKAIGFLSNQLGLQCWSDGDNQKAITFFNESLEARKNLDDKKGQTIVLIELGLMALKNNEADKSIINFQQALIISPVSKLQKSTALLYALLGKAYEDKKNQEKAIENYLNSISKFTELNDKMALTDLNNHIAELYLKNNNSNKAQDALRTSIKYADENNDDLGKAIALRITGIINYKKSEYEEALENFKSSDALVSQLAVKKLIRDTYFKLYSQETIKKDFYKSNEYNRLYEEEKKLIADYEQGHKLSKEESQSDAKEKQYITDLLESRKAEQLKVLSEKEIEQKKQSTEAELQRLLQEKQLEDLNKKIKESESSQQERENQIQTLLKDKALQDLALREKQLELSKQDLQISQQKQFGIKLIGIIIVVLLLALFLYLRYRQKKNSMEKVDKAYKELSDAHVQLKSAQDQLIHSEKMASLGQLTAGIAHEIQNPLNFVTNFSHLSIELINEIKSAKNDEEKNDLLKDLVQNLEKINHHGQRADHIVKGMLMHSRSGNHEKVEMDVNTIITEFMNLAFHGIRATYNDFNCMMEKNLSPDLPKVLVIRQDISRVMLNLFNNAFYSVRQKWLSENQKQTKGYKPLVEVTSSLFDKKVTIAIRDNGTGIPKETMDKIFNPFFTTKPTGQGTGLGLSLSYDIVTKGHGGQLKVESTPGEGSTFFVILPC